MVSKSEGDGATAAFVTWRDFGKPSLITEYGTNDWSEFDYDGNQNRVIQVSREGSGVRKKLYLGGLEMSFSCTSTPSDTDLDLYGPTHARNNDWRGWGWEQESVRIYIQAPTGVVGVYNYHPDGDSEGRKQRRSFLHGDRLGSITLTTDEYGEVRDRVSFDAWGRKRDANSGWIWEHPEDISWSKARDTDHGFTGHEQLDHLGLVHMNGRIYDSLIGRFLSPDPTLQFPGNLQNYHRYAYVLNNPLSLIDPSGYSAVGDWFRSIGNAFKENWKTVAVIVVAAVVTYFTAGAAAGWGWVKALGDFASVAVGAIGGAAGGFAAAFTGTMLYGGSLGDALTAGARGGFWGAVSGAAAGYIGGQDWKRWAQALAHGVSQGAVQDLRGEGSFASGFYSAAMAKYMGQFSLGNPYADLTYLAVVGGTASEVGGGKFANGAVTAVFVKLLNDDQHEDPDNREDQKKQGFRDAVNETRLVSTDEDGNSTYETDIVIRRDMSGPRPRSGDRRAWAYMKRIRGYQGKVTVGYIVSAEGQISNVHVIDQTFRAALQPPFDLGISKGGWGVGIQVRTRVDAFYDFNSTGNSVGIRLEAYTDVRLGLSIPAKWVRAKLPWLDHELSAHAGSGSFTIQGDQ